MTDTKKLGTKEFQDYLLKDLDTPTEAIEKKGKIHPKAMGLWNWCTRNIGTLSTETNVVKCPTEDDVTATTVVNVSMRPYETNILDGQLYPDKTYTSSGASDTGPYNNPEFHRWSVATSETVALGRALKKLLCLNVHTIEEISVDMNKLPDLDSSSKMTLAQRKLCVKYIEEQGICTKKLFKEFKIDLENFDSLKCKRDKIMGLLESLTKWSNKEAPKKYLKDVE